jgi:predicted alpha/beta-fold hydrolase
MVTFLFYFFLFVYFPLLFLVYYFREVAAKPTVHCSASPWNARAIASLPILKEFYYPTFWCFNRHLMLILILLRDYYSKPYQYDHIDEIKMPDGGITGIAWTGTTGLSEKTKTPIAIIFHTISGDEQDVKKTVTNLRKRLGWIVVVCIRRGHGNLPLGTPVINTMGSTKDLKIQLDFIQKKFPNSALYGFGLSAGSGLLARYLGETGRKSVFQAAVAISPAYDIEKAFHRIHPVYNRLMGQRLINYFLDKHYESLSEIPGYLKLSQSKSIVEFQDRLHLIAGYDTKEAYYRDSNPIHVIKNIKTSLLVLNSEDDPICVNLNVIENMHWLESLPKTILVKTKRGSHIVFYEGLFAESWSDRLVCDYFQHMHSELTAV